MRGILTTVSVISLLLLILACVIKYRVGEDLAVVIVLCSIAPSLWVLDRLFGGPPRPEDDIPRCLTCGYDLRATPGRCPECGTEPWVEPKDV